MVGWHRSHVGRIDAIGQVEQAAAGGLLDEVVEDLVDDVFEVGEKAIDRVSRRRSIESAAEPDERALNLLCDGSDAVNVLVVTMEEATHQLWGLMVSCSPRLRRDEHVELFEKPEGEMLKQRERLRCHDIEERLYRRIILQGRSAHPSQRSPCSLVW